MARALLSRAFSCTGRMKDKMDKDKLRIIPLGGVSEIGKNMTAVEYGGQILIIDCGLMFPDEEMLGVDIVIPDVSYLLENIEKVQGIILTHGHEDHIGALPYVLRQMNVPIWGSRLTLGFVKSKLDEHHLTDTTETHEMEPGDRFNIGLFDIQTIRVTHSIPDCMALAVRLPVGTLLHTGDFKFDLTPVDGKPVDIPSFAQLGKEGVKVLMIDSTNVEKPGHVKSERVVVQMFEEVFAKARGKIIVATFASNINRIQQVFNTAALFGRKVAVEGRSMAQNIDIAEDLGYLVIPPNTKIQLSEIPGLYPVEVAILTTGSQGEPLSALTRIATDDHKKIKIAKGDTVVISATPIPGNEDLVSRTINRLFGRGANVIYDAVQPVHVSGHANSEDIKLMLNLTQPEFVIPVHGERRHIAKFTDLAEDMGIPKENCFGMDVGQVLEVDEDGARIDGQVTSGDVLVDGIGVGDVGEVVLRDRRHLASDGMFMVVISIDRKSGTIAAGPDVISRGFIFVDESEALVEEAKNCVVELLEGMDPDALVELTTIKADIRSAVAKLLYTRTRRRPMVVPVIMEI